MYTEIDIIEPPKPLSVVSNTYGLYPGTNVLFVSPVDPWSISEVELREILAATISTRGG